MVPSKMDSPIWGMTMSVPGPAAAGVGAGGAAGASTAASAFGAAGVTAGAGAAVEPDSAITPTTVLIWTVVPSGILISERTPAAGDGISASTLSVEISKSGSSRWTVSPGFLSHLVIVPSKIDSPIWGMITSVGMNSLSAILQRPYDSQLLIINRCFGPRLARDQTV